VRFVSSEPDGFSNLLEKARGILHSEALSDTVAIVFINFVEESHHGVADILSTGTQRLTNVVDKVLSFILCQNLSVEVPNLLEFLRRMNEFVSASKTFHTSEARAE